MSAERRLDRSAWLNAHQAGLHPAGGELGVERGEGRTGWADQETGPTVGWGGTGRHRQRADASDPYFASSTPFRLVRTIFGWEAQAESQPATLRLPAQEVDPAAPVVGRSPDPTDGGSGHPGPPVRAQRGVGLPSG